VKRDTWLELLDKLAHATEAGRVSWQSSDRQGTYVVAQSTGSVVITARQAVNAIPEYVVELYDPRGIEQAHLILSHGPDAVADQHHARATKDVERILAAIERRTSEAETLARRFMAELIGED
jgi:hypothetical protein